MSTLIQFRRGLESALPATPASGEPLWTTDTNKLYIGTGASRIQVGGAAYTDEQAQDAAAAAFAAGTHTAVTVTYNDAANSLSLAAVTQMSVTADAGGLKLS